MGKKAVRTRRSFSDEVRSETVKLVRDSGKSVGAIARDLDLTETALRNWVQRAEVEAGRGPAGVLTTSEHEELVRLRRENRRLQMDFFWTIELELVYESEWTTRAEARAAIFEYLEVFYDGERRHSSLGYLSPAAFERSHEEKNRAAQPGCLPNRGRFNSRVAQPETDEPLGLDGDALVGRGGASF